MIWRRDRQPTLTVQSSDHTQPDTVVRRLQQKFADLQAKLPPEFQIEVGGTAEETAKAQKSVFAVLPIMLILILTTLMLQLHSFSSLFFVIRRLSVWIDRRGRGVAAL